jgi:hypothetical protein
MNSNEKKTYQVLFLVGIIAFLVVTTYGMAQIWILLSVSREKTEIFNEVKDLPSVYTPKVNWLADEVLERPMEIHTRKILERDFVKALYQRNLAILTKDTSKIEDYFTVLAKDKVKTKIDEQKNYSIEQIELNHNLKLSFYSADGQIVAFSDYDSEHMERVWIKDQKDMLNDQSTASYQVIMMWEDGYWRIQNMKRIEAKNPFPDTLQIPDVALKKERLSRLQNAKGINYYPQESPFKNFWINYNSAQVEKDFKFIKKLNFNAVRIFINYEQFGKGNVIPEMMERLDHLMNVAEMNKIGVILTLFDFNSDFNLLNFTSTDRQLETLLTQMKNKKALLAYDLKNEPDIDYNYQAEALVNQWLEFVIKKAKTYDPNTPITIGWADADKAMYLSNELDFVSFHFYKKADVFISDISKLKGKLKGKPLVVSEYGKSDFQSLVFPIWNPRNYVFGQISEISKTLKKENIPGFYWTLYDFKNVTADVAGRWPWQKEPQKHFGLIGLDGKIKDTSLIIIKNEEFQSNSILGNVPKFVYLYAFIGVVFVLFWLKKEAIAFAFVRFKSSFINRFLK